MHVPEFELREILNLRLTTSSVAENRGRCSPASLVPHCRTVGGESGALLPSIFRADRRDATQRGPQVV